MITDKSPPTAAELADQLIRLDQRLERIEQHLGLDVAPAPSSDTSRTDDPTVPATAPGEDFEMIVGQNWFARVGVFVLACGLGFTLTLPHDGLPPAAPGLIGIALAVGMLLFSHYGEATLKRMTGLCRGASMALLYLAALRLFFFGSTPAMEITGLGGKSVLVALVGANLMLALHQRSLPHVILGFLTGYLTAALVGTPWFVFLLLTALTILGVRVAIRQTWPALLLFVSFGTFFTHIYWAVGRPWTGRSAHFVTEPSLGLYAILLYIALLALGPLSRKDRSTEDQVSVLVAVLSCVLGYVLLLVHTLAAFESILPTIHTGAALVFLALAAAHWLREKSQIMTFLYAMTGYLALTVVILEVFPRPEVFLWLSLQSLVVVATALWFRSRFIVVANFVIFVMIVSVYMISVREEQGICLGFGVVALLTARILNWQRPRLELQTDFMRNAYLTSAFVVFPYALYHMVPLAYVSLSWVAIALAYYLLNLIVRNRKYRWMGHSTLLLTVGYVLLIDLTQLPPTYRIISFMMLGAVLLVVSMAYTRARTRRRAGSAEVGDGEKHHTE